MAWYTLQVYNNNELFVKNEIDKIINDENGLDNKILECIVPYERVRSISAKKKIETILKKAIYPGYVYVKIEDYNNEVWMRLRNINKVSKFVGEKGVPFPMLEKDIEKIKNQIKTLSKVEDENIRYKISYKKEDEVIIKSGPFVNFTGIVQKHDPITKKVFIETSVFGRPTPVEVSELDVELKTD